MARPTDACKLAVAKMLWLLKDAAMATGTVKWFNTEKGFGFIQPADGGKDVFVHITAVKEAGLMTLTEGQQISFELKTERGKTAAGSLQVM